MMRDAVAALPPLRDIVAEGALRADKAFGQNFLFDLNITGKIARNAGDLTGHTVIEVGPGPGGFDTRVVDGNQSRKSDRYRERSAYCSCPLIVYVT